MAQWDEPFDPEISIRVIVEGHRPYTVPVQGRFWWDTPDACGVDYWVDLPFQEDSPVVLAQSQYTIPEKELELPDATTVRNFDGGDVADFCDADGLADKIIKRSPYTAKWRRKKWVLVPKTGSQPPLPENYQRLL